MLSFSAITRRSLPLPGKAGITAMIKRYGENGVVNTNELKSYFLRNDVTQQDSTAICYFSKHENSVRVD